MRVYSHTSGGQPRLSDEVGVHLDTTIVGHALNEFDKSNGIDLPGNSSANAVKGGELFLGREVIAVTEVAFLKSGLAFRKEEGRWRIRVERWVFALWVTRGVE